MKFRPFKLERYFVPYEFSARYLLSCSDCDGLVLKDLLELADDEMKKSWENLTLAYTESPGNILLRKEVAKLYAGIDHNRVLIVTPQEGILIALNTILNKGDHVISTFPGYQSLYEIAESIGCEVTKWQPNEANGWKFEVKFLQQNIRPSTRLIIINFPHNPTGYIPPIDDFREIIQLAQKYNIHIFSDEMYRLLELHNDDRLPSACELYDKAVSLFGMSKTFGMAGVRIGWLVVKNKQLYQEMEKYKDYTTICSNAPGEILSIIALRAKDSIIGGHMIRIKRNLSLLDVFFDSHKDLFTWVRPRAGTIGFPKIKKDIKASEFCLKVVNEAGIMVLPSTVYDYDNKHFRIGFGRENLPEALQKFDEYLNKASL